MENEENKDKIIINKDNIFDESTVNEEQLRTILKLKAIGIEPIQMKTESGETVFGYLIDKDGLWWGKKTQKS